MTTSYRSYRPAATLASVSTLDGGAGRSPAQLVELTVSTAGTEDFTVPASYAQERIWFASQLAGGGALYHVEDRIAMRGIETVEAALDALGQLVERHEALRTTLHFVDGHLQQTVRASITAEVAVFDLTDLPDEVKPAEVNRLSRALTEQQIAMDRPPLWRSCLSRLSENEWRLSLSIHHTVVDAASLLILRGELTELCAATFADRPIALAELPIQYADYSVWQRTELDDGSLSDLDRYWRQTLDGIPAVHGIPTDHPRGGGRSFGGADLIALLPPGTSDRLAAVGRSSRATDFMILCAVYLALVNRWSQSDDIVIGLPVTGRDRPELDRVVGMFVNMVVLRVDASGDPTMEALIDRVRTVTLDALDHQRMPFQRLVQQLAGQRDNGAAPLYQLGFNFLPMDELESARGSAEDDLLCEVGLRHLRIVYNTAVFTGDTAQALVEDYLTILSRTLDDTSIRLSELPAPTRTGHPAPGSDASTSAGDTSAGDTSTGSTSDRPIPGSVIETAALSATEQLVADTWCEVLDIDQTGESLVPSDDFFVLGGHSLLALRVIARLRDAAGVDIGIQDFFEDTTVAGVAVAVERSILAEIAALSDDQADDLTGDNG
jgi:acyl carrier protein